jgi:hypothetical protein
VLTAGTNRLMCLPKHGGARRNKFLVTHPMTDQRCLTSAIARRAHCPRGRRAPHIIELKIRFFTSKEVYDHKKINVWLLFQLHIASANGYIKVVEFLLEHRASTDVVDHDVWQPVHAAACWGHVSIHLSCLLYLRIHNNIRMLRTTVTQQYFGEYLFDGPADRLVV